MSVFKDSINWELAVQRLRLSCTGQVIDLQLVWLFEILSILLFRNILSSKYVLRITDAWQLTHKNMVNLVDTVGISKRLIRRLGEYRDTFCHFGFLDAKPIMQDVLSEFNSEEWGRLQQYTGVTLNLRNQLSL